MAPMTRDIRLAAEQLYPNYNNIHYRPNIEISRNSQSHSINLITEDFIAGYMQDGRMSVVRRFFCLFVTFDLFFISLLWLICVMITGENIYDALTKQVLHYSIYTSLFDIVMAAVCRFTVLILFYALLYINHWIIIALSTSGSCAFLISKVFVYNWTGTPQPVFEVLLVIISFVIAWGEAWFLDCRVIPQERHAQNYFTTTGPMDERSPLLEPFLRSVPGGTSESYGNFYSPYESVHNSDNEEDDDDKDEEYKQMAVDSVKRAYELLESNDWKIEKITQIGDTIKSSNRHSLGKIYRLTGEINCNPRILLENLFYKIEDVPKWNPTLLESRIIHKIDKQTDITYQATTGGGGGIVKCRDFVNLRCWQYLKNGEIIKDPFNSDEINRSLSKVSQIRTEKQIKTPPNSITTNSLIDLTDDSVESKIITSISDNRLSNSSTTTTTAVTSVKEINSNPFMTLSKSLGAKDFRSTERVDDVAGTSVASITFNAETRDSVSNPNSYKEITNNVKVTNQDDDDDEEKDEYSDACDSNNNNNLYISAALSIEYPGLPPNNKYIRGENVVSCWAMREINNVNDRCIFEWLLCLDLKGNIPRYFLETVYTTLMQEYMTHLRKYCADMQCIDKEKSG